uniref:Putative chymotrypsin bi-signalp detected n=1 Tax=Lutzomyia longipalpis TaxID=7200 RepID=A0A1B0CTN8_LUTLO
MKIFLASLLVFGLAIDLVVSQAALPGQFPSHGALIFQGRICGATVLNNRHVLSAASCGLSPTFERLPVAAYTLHLGVVNIPATPGMGIIQFYIHEEYNPHHEHWNNIAVFRTAVNILLDLPPPAPQISAVETYNRIVPDEENCVLVGWNAPPQHTLIPLQHQVQAIFSREYCNSLPQVAGSVLDSMVCAGSILVNPNPCPNNPGGALYCHGRLFAIMSHNRQCGMPNAPGVYTQYRFYENWIQVQMNRTDTPPAGPTPPPGHSGAESIAGIPLFTLLALLVLRLLA